MQQTSWQSLWMVVASLLFSCMGVCVKLASEHHSAAEIVFWRSAVSLLLVAGLLRWQRAGFASPELGLQIFRGLTGFVSLALYFIAIVMLPLPTAVTLNYTSPLFLALFLAALAGMRPGASLLAALVVGFVGVGFVMRPVFHAEQTTGAFAAIGSGFMAGLAYFNVRELGSRGEPESRTVFYFSLVATICGAGWMALSDFHEVTLKSASLLLGVAVFATLAQLAMTRAYKLGKTLVSASLAYTAVIFASLFGVLVWDDRLEWASWAGMALIAASGIVATALGRGRTPGKSQPAVTTAPVPD